MISSAAYHNLRKSGMLPLPSERTLCDYSNVVQGEDGFKMEVLQQLYDEARMGLNNIPAHRQFMGIVVDEIYIKSDLVYDRHSSKTNRFCQPWYCKQTIGCTGGVICSCHCYPFPYCHGEENFSVELPLGQFSNCRNHVGQPLQHTMASCGALRKI